MTTTRSFFAAMLAVGMTVASGPSAALENASAHPASSHDVSHQPPLHLGKRIRIVRSRYFQKVRRTLPYVNPRLVAERQGFKAVSSLVPFPSFFPGLGAVYVKPATLPVGPFLCFDRKDRFMSTVYMIPIADFNDHKKFDLDRFAKGGDHLTLYFNSGHPGVMIPHYHVVVWHVSKKDEEAVAK